MEKALWNGKLVLASAVATNFQIENEIRKASGHKELKCPDPNCGNPIVKYCHGDEKEAYFAHLNNECCDYARYDKDTLPIIKPIKTKLFHSLQGKGFHIDIDVKILAHHYTPLIVETENAVKIAIEFGTKQTSEKTTSFLSDQYANIGVLLRWIVVDDYLIPWNEASVCHIKRFILNTSKNRDLLIISKDGSCVVHNIEDQNRYEYRGRAICLSNYSAFFHQKVTLDDITIENNELTAINFYKSFEMWLLKKRQKFEERVQELQEEERLAEEQKQQQEKVFHIKKEGQIKSFQKSQSTYFGVGDTQFCEENAIPIKHIKYGDGLMIMDRRGKGEKVRLKFRDREYDSTIEELQNDNNYYFG